MNLNWAVLRFPFDDARWKNKALVGGAMTFVAATVSFPFFFLMLPVLGYGIRIMKRTARGEEASLPEWDNWGELFMDGLKQWAVSIVYGLPVVVIFSCLIGTMMVGMIGGTAMLDEMSRAEAALASGLGIVGFYSILFLTYAVLFIIGIPLAYLGAVAVSRMAATGELSAAFEFGEVMKLARSGFRHYAIAVIAYLAVYFAGSIVATVLIYTLCLSCLYPFALAATVMYSITMFGATFGEAYYRTTREKVDLTELTPPKGTKPLKSAAADAPPAKEDVARIAAALEEDLKPARSKTEPNKKTAGRKKKTDQ
jgi:hypothetical protein